MINFCVEGMPGLHIASSQYQSKQEGKPLPRLVGNVSALTALQSRDEEGLGATWSGMCMELTS